MAYHKFNAREDDREFYWRGRITQLPIYPEAGRPAELQGGKRVQVYLDAEIPNTPFALQTPARRRATPQAWIFLGLPRGRLGGSGEAGGGAGGAGGAGGGG